MPSLHTAHKNKNVNLGLACNRHKQWKPHKHLAFHDSSCNDTHAYPHTICPMGAIYTFEWETESRSIIFRFA